MEASQPQPAPLDETPGARRSFVTAKELRESGLVGMWKDDPDTKPSGDFLARIREQIWGRAGGGGRKRPHHDA